MKNLQLFLLTIVSFLVISFVSPTVKGANESIITITKTESIEIESSASIKPISSKSKANKMSHPVVILYAIVQEDLGYYTVGHATGFSVAYDKKNDRTYLLTNEHFCNAEEGISFIGKVNDGENASLYYDGIPDLNLKLEAKDPSRDLCLLSTDGFIRPVKVNKSKIKLEQFDKLFIVGSPEENFPIILEEYFSGYVNRNLNEQMQSASENKFILISGEFHEGHSGSPVFNHKGELVGIMFASSIKDEVEDVYGEPIYEFTYGGIAIPLQDILDFLEENGIK